MIGATAILLLSLAVGNTVVLVSILRRSRVTEPACGHCGYAVRGLESVRCPECGGHLPTVGIVTGRMVPTVPTWLLAVLAAVIVTALMPLPVRWSMQLRNRIYPPAFLITETATFRSNARDINVQADLVQRRGGLENPAFRLAAVNGDGEEGAALEVVLADGQLRIAGTGTGAGSTSLEDAITRWLMQSPPPDTRAVSEEQAAGMAGVLTRNLARRQSGDVWISTEPFFGVSATSSTTLLPRRQWLTTATFFFWFAVWLGAMIAIVWWSLRRRILMNLGPDRGS